MNKKESKTEREKRIQAEAAQWVARKFTGFTPEDQDAFFEWMASDPAHSEAYLEYQELWGRMDSLAEWAPEHSEKPHRDLLKNRQSVLRKVWFGGIAALLVFAALLWLPGQFGTDEGKQMSLVANAYARHNLPDGSVVEMKTGSALMVAFSASERRVELVASEALFTVAKDATRPFVVVARGVEVRAVGTAFNVRVSESEIEVLVTEGRVQLDSGSVLPAEALSSNGESTPVEELVAGQVSTVSLKQQGRRPIVAQASDEEILQKLDWKYRLEFDAIPLSEAVAQINERGSMELVIVDAELRELPIVATLRTDKIHHFAEILEISFGIATEVDSRGRMLLKQGRNAR